MPLVRAVVVPLVRAVVVASVRVVVVPLVRAVVVASVGVVVMALVRAMVVLSMSPFGLSHCYKPVLDVEDCSAPPRSAFKPGRSFQVPQVTVFAALGGRLADLYRHLAYLVLIVDQAAHLTQEML